MSDEEVGLRRPTHLLYAVIDDDDETTAGPWRVVGLAWSKRDGTGYSLKLDAFPTTGWLTMREREPKADQSAN